MNQWIFYISRQILIAAMALQFLNMSVCSEAYSDDYDYSYTYNSYDPTETAVELIVEMKYGQQPAFTYDRHVDTGKKIARSFHWHPYLQPIFSAGADYRKTSSLTKEARSEKITSTSPEVISPPPESVPA
jgi:hypothetical protein